MCVPRSSPSQNWLCDFCFEDLIFSSWSVFESSNFLNLPWNIRFPNLLHFLIENHKTVDLDSLKILLETSKKILFANSPGSYISEPKLHHFLIENSTLEKKIKKNWLEKTAKKVWAAENFESLSSEGEPIQSLNLLHFPIEMPVPIKLSFFLDVGS